MATEQYQLGYEDGYRDGVNASLSQETSEPEMMKTHSVQVVYVADIVTESSDYYIWVYSSKPTREQVIQRLYEVERAADLDWYTDTTSVTISEQEVIDL